jgi:putative mRNA 3-end processing factor
VAPLIQTDDSGLHCAAGKFHVDPWRPVETAVVTHGHGDHARPGSRRYHCTEEAAPVLARRLGGECELVPHPYGEPFTLGEAQVSFHSAGHVRGSAQIRIEHGGEVWVVSGDYKRAADPTCAPFELVPCDVFVTEATFALPVYRWPGADEVVGEIFDWWEANRAAGRASVLFCYVLGKAQRILAELSRYTQRPVYVHGAVESLTALYRAAGVEMLPTLLVTEATRKRALVGELVLAPPPARRTPWMKRIGDHETAFASGWMRLRGARRRRGFDRGFVLSDHADWPSLLRTVEETGARRVLVTHGYSDALVRILRERGVDADALVTPFTGEPDEREEM